jgi:uncharacterized membrane protein
MSIAITLHMLAAVIWVGGMFFAYFVLRPAAAQHLEPPQRLPLWLQCFSNFFLWVWVFIALLPATGYWMIFQVFGGMTSVGLYVHLMHGLGWIMILLFIHLYFAPFKRFRNSVDKSDWPTAGKYLNQIRLLISINLTIGLAVIAIAAGGRYF